MMKRIEKPAIALIPRLPHSTEWLFREDEVPDAELAACLTWEYMREIRQEDLGAEGLVVYAFKLLYSAENPKLRKFSEETNTVPFNIIAYLVDTPPPVLQAWQLISRDLRNELNKPLRSHWGPLVPLEFMKSAPVYWNCFVPPKTTETSELREVLSYIPHLAAYKPREGLSEEPVSDPIPNQTPHTPLKLGDRRQWLEGRINNLQITPFPFLINWSEYSAAEIQKEIGDWIARTRPTFLPTNRPIASPVALRHRLRDLGAMRILKAMTDKTFRQQDEAFRKFSAPLGSRTQPKGGKIELPKLRKKAEAFFRSHFALTDNQIPLSWSPPRRGATSARRSK